MNEKNRNIEYEQLAKKMQKVADEITRNFPLNNILPQMKIIQEKISNLRMFPISEELQTFILEAKASENLSHEDFMNKYGTKLIYAKLLEKQGGLYHNIQNLWKSNSLRL